jgi:hypothetical protein
MQSPRFSVVMATFGRGRHILPSVKSVLQQTTQDFELLVVGDHCEDDTEEVVRPFLGDRVRWLNLSERWFSQSGPNNAGVEAARGEYIAYIGHDDVWSPQHLQSLADVFERPSAPHFAIGGAIWHAPPGVDRPRVSGLFEDPSEATLHFFPPSSISHRADVFRAIGPWSRASEIRQAVDVDFQLRSLAAGLEYEATGRISVHKFAAAMRYLSYLRQASHEQEAMLQAMDRPAFGFWIEEQVALAKKQGGYMVWRLGNYDNVEPGQLARGFLANKGVTLPPILPLGGGICLPQRPGNFGFDWSDEPDGQIRWVGFNPNPKWLVNVTSDQAARMAFALAHHPATSLASIAIEGPGIGDLETGPEEQVSPELSLTMLSFEIHLSASDYSVLTFHLTRELTAGEETRGIGLATVYILPSDVDRSLIAELGLLARFWAERDQAKTKEPKTPQPNTQQLLRDKDDEFAELRTAHDTLRTDLAETARALTEHQTRLRAIETSTSWRATSVLRSVIGWWRNFRTTK